MDEIECKLLEELEFFTQNDLEILENFNIKTLGDLLSATKGLQRFFVFEDICDKEEKLIKLRELVPIETIKKHREFVQEHPMGEVSDENHKQ